MSSAILHEALRPILLRDEAITGDASRTRALYRVATCINSMAISGGSELNAVRTAEQLKARGHDVEVMTLTDVHDGMYERYADAGIAVHGFGVDSLVGRQALRQVRALSRAFRQGRFDIVHTNDSYTNFLMVAAARLAGIPALASKRWIQPMFSQHRYTDAIAFRLAHGVLANSVAVGRTAQRIEGVAAERVHVVPNFVDDQLFAVRAERPQWRAQYGFAEEHVVFCIVAQLRAEKNHVLLLRAFAGALQANPQVRLLVVGDGPERAHVADVIEDLGVSSQVTMTGHLDRAWRTFAAADVAVLPSQHEGFPNSVVEAMAVGIPVIGTNVGGIPDAITDQQSGLLVEPNSLPALKRALLRMAGDAAFRHVSGLRAQRFAEAHHTADAVLDSLERVYATVTGARR